VTTMAPSAHPRRDRPRLRLTSLVDYAVLAPSSHNTQPWTFAVSGHELRVYVDYDRWLRIADPDKRELYVSAGCALENLLVAAAHRGYEARVTYVTDDRADGLAAIVEFEAGGEKAAKRAPLFVALRARHTNRRPYLKRRIAREVVTRLYDAVYDEGVQLWLFTDAEMSGRIQHLLRVAERTQFSDRAYRRELGESIGSGAFGDGWLKATIGRLLVQSVDVGPAAVRRDVALLRSAPALAVLTSFANDRSAQVRAGQAFERVALTATKMGVATQPMSALLELPLTRAALADLLPEEVFPQHAFRLGYAPPERRRTRRRTVAEVLQPTPEEERL
jgi:nitroreductase